MENEVLKAGGIIEIKDNQRLRVIELIEKRKKNFALCVNENKKSEPIIIEYKYDNGELVYRVERDKKTLLEVYYDVYKNSSKPYGM
ncbi:MAG: hypothetical protein K6D97_03865 [Clostridia bacterium]|nr:hypothetical protein [Clostridia bacterium]